MLKSEFKAITTPIGEKEIEIYEAELIAVEAGENKDFVQISLDLNQIELT